MNAQQGTFRDPETGRTVTLKWEGEASPTEQELEEVFASLPNDANAPAVNETALATDAEPIAAGLDGSDIPEIGYAPELNAMSVPAFKASMGLLTTGDESSLRGIFSQQFGDDVSFDTDQEGRTVVNLPSGQYALNKPGVSPQDVARFAFDMLSFTPAAKAKSVVGSIVSNAATQLGIEGTEASLGGDITPENVAMAGLLGGGGKVVENALGTGYRVIRGKPVSDVVDAGQEAGIPILTSDAMQPQGITKRLARDFAEKIPIAGTGPVREAQQARRQSAVSDFIGGYAPPSFDDIVSSLKSQKSRVKKAAGSVLQSTGEKLDDVGEVPLTNTMQAIDEAREIFSRPGVLNGSDALGEVDRLAQTMGEAPQMFSMLKENRTAFRDLVKNADRADRSQMTTRGKALLQNIEQSMRRDMDSWASKHLPEKEYNSWVKANAIYEDEAIKFTKSRLKGVLDKGDITPENAGLMLFSKKPSEVRSLYKSLTPSGRKNARAAVIDKVVTDLARRGEITPNGFASEMKKYGLQVNELFRGEEKKVIKGLLKALDHTRRAQDSAVTTPTGQGLFNLLGVIGISVDPATTLTAGATIGSLARLYESPAFRNAALRLDSIPVGSTQFEQGLAALRESAAPIAQASLPSMGEGSETTQEQLSE